MVTMTEEELTNHFVQVCNHLKAAEAADEGVLFDTIEVYVLAYALRSMSHALHDLGFDK